MKENLLITLLGELHKIVKEHNDNEMLLPEQIDLKFETVMDGREVLLKTSVNTFNFLDEMAKLEQIVLGDDKVDIECNCPVCKYKRELEEGGKKITKTMLFKN